MNTDQSNWPQTWKLFGPLNSANIAIRDILSMPDHITVEGQIIQGISRQMDESRFDFASIFGDSSEQRIVYGVATIDLAQATQYTVGAGADWWMQWFIDGEEVYSTLRTGNEFNDFSIADHTFTVDLDAGSHTICFMVLAGSAGWQLTAAGGDVYESIASDEIRKVTAARQQQREEAERLLRELEERAQTNRQMKLVVYGSSVAWGAGAANDYGWAARLKEALEERGGWTVVNKSVGGDMTTKLLARIDTDLLPEKPDIVIIALSLSNEGIKGTDPDAIYQQFRRNLRKLIQLCRKNGIVPVLTNCYANDEFSETHYRYIKSFNAELDLWNVASINFLGMINDGQGGWKQGTATDPGHPNDSGHHEMFHAIPVSMFDYLSDSSYPFPDAGDGCLMCLEGAQKSVLSYKPESTLHSFSVAFECLFPELPNEECVIAELDSSSILLDSTGTIVYRSGDNSIAAEQVVEAGEAAHLAICHDHLDQNTRLYIDSTCAGDLAEELSPGEFYLGGGRDCGITAHVFYRSFLLYRGCLRADQVAELSAGRVLHSSLELYAPLTDTAPEEGVFLRNLAPTEGQLKVQSHNCRSIGS